jgi:predicted phage-related endonuclease
VLSPAEITARRYRLGASDIACLMLGDAPKIMRLWQEKLGEIEPENLDHVWPVQLGSATEELNLRWYAMKNGIVTRMGEIVIHPKYRWAGVTLDGWDESLSCPIECKHVGGREPLEIIVERYQPQMQWQMEVTGAKQCALSVIMGANEPVTEYIEFDPVYAAEMISRGAQFWRCVEQCTPPVVLDPVAPPTDATKIIDMTGNNSWASSASVWLETKLQADVCKDAEKILKSLVPADAKKCHGHGIQITRDRAGRLSLREEIS